MPILIIITVVVLLGILWIVMGMDMEDMISLFEVSDPPEMVIEGEADADGATVEGIRNVEEASNKFAWEMYSEISEEGENLLFSPYSISTALSMTYEGAKGDTAEEIKEVLGIPEKDDVRQPAIAAIYNRLNPEEPEYEWGVANSVWIEEEYEALSEFIDTLERFYVAKAENLDFQSEPEASRVEINEWVKEKTNDLIEELFVEGSITVDTRLVIANAIHFKGEWMTGFEEEYTKEEEFHIDEENVVEVPMMQGEEEYGYYENDEVQILEMDYKGEELSMLFFLPKDKNLHSLEEDISLEEIDEWREEIEERKVSVYLPKFEMDTSYDLEEYLQNLGITSAFSKEADFTGMHEEGEEELMIDDIVHDAFLSVDEEGTEAAAATGVEFQPVSADMEDEEELPIFRADHPFLFLLQEKESGHILFLGRMIDPS